MYTHRCVFNLLSYWWPLCVCALQLKHFTLNLPRQAVPHCCCSPFCLLPPVDLLVLLFLYLVIDWITSIKLKSLWRWSGGGSEHLQAKCKLFLKVELYWYLIFEAVINKVKSMHPYMKEWVHLLLYFFHKHIFQCISIYIMADFSMLKCHMYRENTFKISCWKISQ